MTKVVPCDPENPPLWAARLAAHVLTRTVSFFAGFDVVLDEGAREVMEESGRPVVVGLEPHSTLPMAAVLAFARFSPLAPGLPRALRGARLLASNACFSAPIVRHAWSWLGFAPASRETMARLLTTGTISSSSPPASSPSSSDDRGVSVVLCPGGIREVLHLRTDRETIYLRSRRGFVRQALRAGAPLVPAFAFGQTGAFDWFPVLPSPPIPRALVSWLCRSAGFAPLWIHNGWLFPFPKRSAAMTLVIGKPLEFSPRSRSMSTTAAATATATATAAEMLEEATFITNTAPWPTLELDGTENKNEKTTGNKRRGIRSRIPISCSSALTLPLSSSEASAAETDDASAAAASANKGNETSSSVPAFDEEDVDRYLEEFVQAMKSLYERHAPSLGCADVPLMIL